MLVTSMFVADASVNELWILETIGICDQVEQKSREEKETSVKEHFIQTVTCSEEGRYIVALPWTVESPQIPDNREVAEKRLVSMTTKLQSRGQGGEVNLFKSDVREGPKHVGVFTNCFVEISGWQDRCNCRYQKGLPDDRG